MAIILFLVIATSIILIIKLFSNHKTETKKQLDYHIDAEVERPNAPKEKGRLTLSSNGDITLSSGGNSVTLIGASEQIANEIMVMCDSPKSYYEWTKDVSNILMANEIQIKEVEHFRAKVLPIVERRVSELIKKDNEWESLGERDKEDKMEEYRNVSMVEFDEEVSPAMSGALSYLTFNNPIQVPQLNELIKEYGIRNMNTYCEYYGRKNPIITISNINYRKSLEELVTVGLAYSGKDLSVEELLSTLTLSQLNDIALSDTKFTKKEKAIKYIAEKENVTSIIENNITLRALFSLSPLPEKFNGFDIEKYKEVRDYYDNLADVLVSLYKGYSPMKYKLN